MGMWRARCGANSHAGFGGAGRGNGPSEKAAPRPGPTLRVPAAGAGAGGVAGQRPRRQAPAWPSQDRQAGCGVAVQVERAGHAAALVRPARPDPPAAGLHPAACGPDPGALPAQAAAGAGCRVDALIKLSTVATDIFGVSGRAMLEALITGERDPKVLAE